MNERPATTDHSTDDIPQYLARYAAEVDAWAGAARAGRP